MAEDLQEKWAGAEKMQHTATDTSNASFPPIGLSAARDHRSAPPQPVACASCDSGARGLIFGDEPDGLVLCRECRSPLFYCDLGGQG